MSSKELRQSHRRHRRLMLWAGQLSLAALVGWFAWRSLADHWSEFRALDIALTPKVLPIAAAAAVVWATYALLIAAWLAVLRGWGDRLGFARGATIWCLSNLGRYLPGRVWSVAGLVVLAQRAGVRGWSAAGSAVALQALAVGTASIVVSMYAPASVPIWMLLLADLFGLLAVGALVTDLGPRLLARLLPSVELRPVRIATAVRAVIITWASWLGYGLALWLLARGLVPGGVGFAVGTAAFAAAYVVGLLAVFAPGGIGVREVMLVALLTPSIGTGPAVTLSVASRLLLTLTEVGAALLALALPTKSSRERNGGLHA